MSSLGDFWLGRELPSRLQLVQRLSSHDGLYRATGPGGRNFFARLTPIDRLRTPKDWSDRAMRLLSVRSRHFARFLDAYEYDEYAVVIADYCEGERLYDRIRRSGPLGAELSLNVTLQICLGLEHFHASNIVHGRLHPRHVLTQVMGKSEVRATVISFGLAQGIDRDGTDEYISNDPTQKNSKRGDVYSVGAMLFEMLTGTSPANALTPQTGLESLSPSAFRSPAALNPALARYGDLCDLVTLMTSSEAADLTIAQVISRLDRTRTSLLAKPLAQRSAPAAFDSDVFNVPDTGFTRKKTDIRRKTTVSVGGEDYNVHLRGSVLKLRPLSRGRSWGPEALRFDLRDYGFDVDLSCVTSIEDTLWFGTSDGQIGRVTPQSGLPELLLENAGGEVVSISGRRGLIVAGCRSGAVHFRVDNQDFRVIESEQEVTHVSVAERALRFAVGRTDGSVNIYEVTDGDVAHINHFSLEGMTGLRLSVDGRQVAVSDPGTTMVRDVVSGERIGSVGQMSELIDTAEILRVATRVNKQ